MDTNAKPQIRPTLAKQTPENQTENGRSFPWARRHLRLFKLLKVRQRKRERDRVGIAYICIREFNINSLACHWSAFDCFPMLKHEFQVVFLKNHWFYIVLLVPLVGFCLISHTEIASGTGAFAQPGAN